MTELLYNLAMADTPELVNVPKDRVSLVVWAIGRFGIGVLVAAVFWHAWRDERDAGRAREDRILQTLESRNKVDAELAVILTSFRQTLDQLRLEAVSAHKPNTR